MKGNTNYFDVYYMFFHLFKKRKEICLNECAYLYFILFTKTGFSTIKILSRWKMKGNNSKSIRSNRVLEYNFIR